MRGYRKERVASRIHEIISEAILQRINDPRVSPLTTVTRVEVTGDLLNATVFLSVSSDAAEERRTITALRHAGGFLQRMVAKELDLRLCPELRFEADEHLKKVRHTLQLLDENRRHLPPSADMDAGSTVASELPHASNADDPGIGNEAGLDAAEELDG